MGKRSSTPDQASLGHPPHHIVDALPWAILFISLPDETCRFANNRASRWLGQPASQIIGQSIRDLFGDEAYHILKQGCPQVHEGHTVEHEATLPLPADAKPRTVRIRLIPETDATTSLTGCLIVIEDMAEIRAAQDLLEQENAELEARIAHRTQELQQLNTELRHEIDSRHAAEQQLTEHREELAHVSRISVLGETATALAHELNQPLAAISNYASAVLKRMEKGDASIEELAVPLREVAAQAERAGNVIRQLREFFRKRQAQVVPLNINELVSETLSLTEFTARSRQIRIDFDPADHLLTTRGDPILFKQVLFNVVHNALDASSDVAPENRQIRLRTTVSSNHNWVQVRVRDWGPGVPADDLIRIFEPFYTTKKEGMGIGLAIAKRIIEAQRGCLSAHRRMPSGLEMIIELPVTPSDDLTV
ncbi:MAG: ATP-binding protein [Phycisphaeraceae bacterium]